MSSIFASKMFKNCKHPGKIIAAVQSPLNQELVLQLKTYLGDDALALLQQTEAKKVAELQSELEEHAAPAAELGDANAMNREPGLPRRGGGAPPSFSSAPDAELDESFSEENAPMPESEEEPTPEAAQAGTQVTLTPIHASTEMLANAGTELLGLLNSRADTAGVNRVGVKDDSELWIYYNDDINLNSVMPTVVNLVFASGYTSLSFNRLARSNNAIVFALEAASAVTPPTVNET